MPPCGRSPSPSPRRDAHVDEHLALHAHGGRDRGDAHGVAARLRERVLDHRGLAALEGLDAILARLRLEDRVGPQRQIQRTDRRLAVEHGRQVEIDGDGVTVIAEDAVSGDKVQQKVDLAVLATGMQPSFAEGGAPAGVSLDENGFVLSDYANGIIGAGCAKKASDVATTTQSSTAAALKAIQVSRR